MAQQPESDPIIREFLHAFPNPNRIGCPGKSTLWALVRDQLPLDHPANDHLLECSPCYKEFLEYQAEWKRRRRTRVLLASAALVVLAVFAGWYWRMQARRSPVEVATNYAVTRTQRPPVFLNFSSPGNRGEPTDDSKEQVFAKPHNELAVLVPPGTPDGQYAVELRSLDERVVMSFPGVVSTDREGAAILRAHVDFNRVSPGEYELRWQGPGPASVGHGTFRILQEPAH